MTIFEKYKSNSEPNLMQLLECAEEIKKSGDVFIIKFDGEREENHYTILVMSTTKKYPTIRADQSTLASALKKAVDRYLSLVESH